MKGNKTFLVPVVAVLSALAASSCCWLPVVLVSLGAGSLVAISGYIKTVRLPVAIVAVLSLWYGFYKVYRKSGKNTAEKFCCEIEEPSCCATSSKGNLTSKISLWIATIFVAVMLFFPQIITSFILSSCSPSQSEKEYPQKELKIISVKIIEGLHCPIGCPTRVKAAVEGLSYVKDVEVLFKEKKAVLTVDNETVNKEEIINKFEDAGFKAKFEE